ncbi:hypothetical protein ONS95_012285 [Cadophora gregata]|uniref:uncharacterized protein n=1 Tax=Cadophora gregata TaxID=51156 RepID=UPI0026DC64F9|nr:uncharacterized protein ONS95_012285 [Cadophora gregata]KAK0117974.1 hypothetical protein ONS95_012285 [Cadophora gregata]KAK0123038.1 hypothetical protein ONS96_010048 [Cadophora gregata f. sp. sojae]
MIFLVNYFLLAVSKDIRSDVYAANVPTFSTKGKTDTVHYVFGMHPFDTIHSGPVAARPKFYITLLVLSVTTYIIAGLAHRPPEIRGRKWLWAGTHPKDALVARPWFKFRVFESHGQNNNE